MKPNKFALVLLAILLMVNVALSCILITRSLNSQKQRTTIEKTTSRFECILFINPNDRTPAEADRRCGKHH